MNRPNELTELIATLAANTSAIAGNTNIGGSFGQASSASNEATTSNGLELLLSQLGQIASQREPAQISSVGRTTPQSNSGDQGNFGLDVLKGIANTVTGGLIPLASGLFKLFSGGSEAPQEPLTRFALPQQIQIEAGLNSTGALSLVDRNVAGDIRSLSPGTSTQVTVQVNAMDSQSFMDRSGDIAQAVRSAMLNSSALNEVVQDL